MLTKQVLLLAAAVLCLGAVWFSSLFAHPAYRPAKIWLCGIENENGWVLRSSRAEMTIDDVTYVVSAHLFDPKVTPSDDKAFRSANGDAFAVEFSGFTAGRAVGWRAPAMRAAAKDGRVRINGSTREALPVLWKREFRSTSQGGGWAFVEVGPSVDMNALGNAGLDPFVVAFPGPRPKPGDEVTFTPGRVQLDQTWYPLPSWKSCSQPGQWYMWRFKG